MKRRRLFRVSLLLIFPAIAAMLWLWTMETETEAHYTPTYDLVDLEPILQKETHAEEDYELLFQQTGLGKAGVEALISSGRQEDIIYLQQRFFTDVEVECFYINAIAKSERLLKDSESKLGRAVQKDFLPTVETGDILVSFNGHVFGWRSGHAAIVVDAEKGQTLEAITIGRDSRICALEQWREYPGFALLRLKGASAVLRAEIAAYAAENLMGIPYRLTSFTGGSDALPLAGTHCSHLVWSAYAHFGYDLDGDGGFIVTPADLFESDLLEVVQIYGLSPES